jgi:asparagine synthetase B (glutamine-hydrolysing)
MCGIGLLFHEANCEESIADLSQQLLRRGPDYQGQLCVSGLLAIGSVLHIQGDHLCPQPVIDDKGNVLLWNGEIFGGLTIPHATSDTLALSLLLRDSLPDSGDELNQKFVECLSAIEGPFAFIYVHASSQQVFFGRDSIGRRSLLQYKLTDQLLLLTSVAIDYNHDMNCNGVVVEEIPIGGIFVVPFSGSLSVLKKLPWPVRRVSLGRELRLNSHLPNDQQVDFDTAVDQFLQLLISAVSRRLGRIGFHLTTPSSDTVARVGVLFSGGIDSLLLAAVLHLSLTDENEPIDLFNVAFITDEKTSLAPDRLGGLAGLLELRVSG